MSILSATTGCTCQCYDANYNISENKIEMWATAATTIYPWSINQANAKHL